ncbi:siderophore-iron reductase, Fe-S cluster protein [Pseudomonas corrugata]|uniref:Siderophore-iron reductase, Fe-S cluster protein n=1 Tax=Pseudomonas corrugata TaxID=47879 RepID=A0A7Y6DHN1_9PSED|nr:IucA/IucC family C-terminal-domain containing protein [Pseudomonas corrugata]NUT87403.1 siderophore-iron reductase, Fe-S cluster protein [Pseudomonas corrugata]
MAVTRGLGIEPAFTDAARRFTAGEWAVLSGPLRLKPAGERDSSRSLAAHELLNGGVCLRLLDELTPVLGSPSRAITASLLSKRMSFLTTNTCLYALSACDKGLLMSLDNSVIEYGHDEGRWTSSMPLLDLEPWTYAAGEREAWREALVGSLFAGLLKPLWDRFAQVSGISRRILWENTAVRVYSLYEKRMDSLRDASTRRRIDADFDWLLNQADPGLFGLDYNPLQHFRRAPMPLADGGCRRLRRTCCFYYQASNPVEYCSACPLLRKRTRHE